MDNTSQQTSQGTSGLSEQSGSAISPIATQRGDRELIRRTFAKLGPATFRAGSLFELLSADPHDPAAITRAVRRGPTMTGRMLAAVNSAAAGVRTRIESVEHAVMMLGASRARAIALSYGLRLLHQGTALPEPVIDVLWSNSLQKAIAARHLAQRIDPALADQAYTLALLQDVGLPALVAVDKVFYEVTMASATSEAAWWDRERQRFGFDHAAAGQYMLLEWGVSTHVQQSILHHHRPPTMPNSPAGDTGLAIATFLASLLPHWSEQATIHQQEWLQAIHARFLAMESATPDQFLMGVAGDMQTMVGEDLAVTPLDRPGYRKEVNRLVGEVAMLSGRLAIKLCRLERAIQRDREGLRDLRAKAFTDPLTCVLNRGGFVEFAQRRITESMQRSEGICCMLFDMDNFKNINDQYGHDAGDRVLRGLAKLLRRKLGTNTIIGRMGGDEFAAILTGVTAQQALARGQQVIDTIHGARLRVFPGVETGISVTLGVVHSEAKAGQTTLDELLKAADNAMYSRKREGKHGLIFATMDEQPDELLPEAEHQSPIRAEVRPEKREL